MEKLAIRRCHGCCGKETYIFKKDCKILEHIIEFTFRSHEW